MIYEDLSTVGDSTFLTLGISRSQVDRLMLTLSTSNSRAAVRRIRGTKSRTTLSLFDECAAALQFPLYFGENWDAFEDCINDLEWLPAEAYLLVVTDAESLLADIDDVDFRIFASILADANKQWLEPTRYFPRDRQPTAFRVIFACSPMELRGFIQRLEQSGHNSESLVFDPNEMK